MSKLKIAIGIDEQKELVFVEIEKDRRFINFSNQSPTIFGELYEDEEEYLKERVENFLDSSDKETLYDMCETFNCSPNNLQDEYIESAGRSGIMYDIANTIEYNDNEIVLEWQSVGYFTKIGEIEKSLVPRDLLERIFNFADKEVENDSYSIIKYQELYAELEKYKYEDFEEEIAKYYLEEEND